MTLNFEKAWAGIRTRAKAESVEPMAEMLRASSVHWRMTEEDSRVMHLM